MNRLFAICFLIVAFLTMFSACGPGRLLSPVVTDRAVEQVVSSMHASQASYDFFSARFSGPVSWEGTKLDLAGTIRIRKDSAIFISVAPVLGIEVARLLITPTEVKMLNRLESTYFEGDMGLINDMLNADLDFYMLQALLTGNDFMHFSRNTFRLSNDPSVVMLNAVNRTRTNSRGQQASAIDQNIWLDNQTFRITQTSIYEKQANRSIQVKYNNYSTVQGQLLPAELMMVFVDPANRAELTIRYSRITINQPQQITFTIPSRYQPADF
jgi:hypothetical protein